MNQSSSIATAFPFLLLITTAIIFFTTGFVSALLVLFGGGLSWFGSYSVLTALIYSRGMQRVIISLLQAAIAYGGYLMITKASFNLTLFGFVVENYHFAFFSLVMGLLMGLTTKPDPDEIERSRTF